MMKNKNQLSVNSLISTDNLIHLIAELIDALKEVASSASIVIIIEFLSNFKSIEDL